jgi:hypothetical protein
MAKVNKKLDDKVVETKKPLKKVSEEKNDKNNNPKRRETGKEDGKPRKK